MLGSSKTGAVRAFVAASSVRNREADPYRDYAAGLYRQALLTRGDPALAEHVVCDVLVNERALARIPEPGEAGAPAIYPGDLAALWHAVMRRLASSSTSRAAVADPLGTGESDADTRIRHGDRHGRRWHGARAGGGQFAAGSAAVHGDEEDVVTQAAVSPHA